MQFVVAEDKTLNFQPLERLIFPNVLKLTSHFNVEYSE